MLWAKMGLLYDRFGRRVTAVYRDNPEGGHAGIVAIIIAAVVAIVSSVVYAVGHDLGHVHG